MVHKVRITSEKTYKRILLLDGAQGAVGCRVYGSMALTRFHFSPGWSLETSLRSRLRLNNLVAVRGRPGEGMVGPADYYGNWENPNDKCYTIQIENGFPVVFQHEANFSASVSEQALSPVPVAAISYVRATWISGRDKSRIAQVQSQYKAHSNPLTGDSLFNTAGVLQIEEGDIVLPNFDARRYDLSPFKARLVANNAPFKITSEGNEIAHSDEWRAVSYHYEAGYAAMQKQRGGGLFLETHQFPQSITPLDSSAGGFVTLAKRVQGGLDLIAVRIPFGYTLIIEKDCIHGDTDLVGMFMMCMTSNHRTMSSADTVFLKDSQTGRNISISLAQDSGLSIDQCVASSGVFADRPLVFYRGEHNSFDIFYKKTRADNFMYNPLSNGWWRKILEDFNHVSLALVGAFVVASLAIMISAILTLGASMLAITAGTACLASTGFFAYRVVVDTEVFPLDMTFEI